MRCIRYPPCSAFMSNGIPQFFSGFDIKISSCRAEAASLVCRPRPPCAWPAPGILEEFCLQQVFFNFCDPPNVACKDRMGKCGFLANHLVRWSHISFRLPAARGTVVKFRAMKHRPANECRSVCHAMTASHPCPSAARFGGGGRADAILLLGSVSATTCHRPQGGPIFRAWKPFQHPRRPANPISPANALIFPCGVRRHLP